MKVLPQRAVTPSAVPGEPALPSEWADVEKLGERKQMGCF